MACVPIIPTVAQIRECERFTMESLHLASIDLMEQAGQALSKRIREIILVRKFPQIHIFCGCGNNGGDGMVIARCLREAFPSEKLSVHVILCQNDNPQYTNELAINRDRWLGLLQDGHFDAKTSSLQIFTPEQALNIPACDLIVDALFGIGLNKPVTGIFADAIRQINASEAYTIAIDIPSGLFADTHTPPSDGIVIADKTLTVQFPKLAFLLPEAFPIYGDVEVIDIGMLPPPDLDCRMEALSEPDIAAMLHPNNPYGNKGTFGHGLLIAGSAPMPGAAILAATSALRGGIGKLTIHTAAKAARHIPSVLPEAILDIDTNENIFTAINWSTVPSGINAIAVGPGIGTHPQTVVALKNLLDEIHTPIILDADALNILSENKTWQAFLPPFSILTPHFKEFERLAGAADNDFHRIELARNFATRYNVILILKGQHTIVSLPDGKQFVNVTGNVCLATAGSGDVLTGLLLALMAQGYNPIETAFLGVFIHGAAGDLYRTNNYERGMLASDLPQLFGKVFHQLQLVNKHFQLNITQQ